MMHPLMLTAAIVLAAAQTGCASTPLSQDASVDERAYVHIGGTEQWIVIQGQSRSNPVLLVLHGGPGSTWDPFTTFFDGWEKHFTIAYWSQRGAGRSFRKTGESIASTMTIDRMTEDGIEVAEFLRSHFPSRPIVLLGHSWGTVLGVKMAQSRPELFAAYVGTGQVVSGTDGERAGYLETLNRAQMAGDSQALAELRSIGLPPYDDISKLVTERRWAGVFDAPSDAAFNAQWTNPSEFSTDDAAERQRAWLFSNYIMFGNTRQDGPLMQVDFRASALAFQLPVFFIQGELDHITPTSLVAEYEARISAPRKAMVRMATGGHNAVFAMKDEFLAEMLRLLESVPGAKR